MSTPVGKTHDQGWEIGVSRTLPVDERTAWEMVLRALGLEQAARAEGPRFERGQVIETAGKIKIEIRSYDHGSLLRMRWRPPEWDFDSTLQVRIKPATSGMTISVHHEKLESGEQRRAMRDRWTALLDGLRAGAEK